MGFLINMKEGFDLFVFFLVAAVIFRLGAVLFLKFTAKPNKIERPWSGGVSVIVPAFNEEENIKGTLNSLLTGTRFPDEIIVVNDGSTDKTEEYAKEIQALYPTTVRIINVKNGGKARALNLGFAEARNPVVVTIDGDTILDSRAIEELIAHFSDMTVGGVGGKVNALGGGGLLDAFQKIEYAVGQNIDKVALASINSCGIIPGAIGAWRRTDVLAVGGYSTDSLVEDQDLTIAILKLGRRVVYEPKAIAHTEAPQNLKGFIKQRFRWTFGTMQCFWKYGDMLFSPRRSNIGWVVLPNIGLYNTLIPMVSPLIDLIVVIALLFGFWEQILVAYIIFTVVDMACAFIGLRHEKHLIGLLFLLPLQRIWYRQLINFIVLKSLIRVLDGTGALWNKVERSGFAQQYFVQIFNRQRMTSDSTLVR